MNLYKLHTQPEILTYFKEGEDTNPHIFWEKYKKFPKVLKKLEKYLAKSTEYAFKYASDVLEGPFPAGEAAIASDEHYAQEYATFVLEDNFYYNGKLIASVY